MAQLGQLRPADRRRFARTTIMLTLLIVAALTIGLSELAVRLHIGIPKHDSTQIADIAHAAAGKRAAYALFQATSALLLLAAASSSFQAGPGLLKALSRHPHSAGVGSCRAASARRTDITRLTGRSSSTCSCRRASLSLRRVGSRSWCSSYAVAVFVSFLAGLAAMMRFSLREGRRGLAAVNAIGALSVAFTLVVNLGRGYPLLSPAATALIAFGLYALWRPTGVEELERIGEWDE
jgi:hypothetical protein